LASAADRYPVSNFSIDGFGCDVFALVTDLGSENKSMVRYPNALEIRGHFYKNSFLCGTGKLWIKAAVFGKLTTSVMRCRRMSLSMSDYFEKVAVEKWG